MVNCRVCGKDVPVDEWKDTGLSPLLASRMSQSIYGNIPNDKQEIINYHRECYYGEIANAQRDSMS